MDKNRSRAIAKLNDNFRTTFLFGHVVITEGVKSLNDETQSSIVEAVQKFNQFNKNNDPWGEHDFGKLTVDGYKIFWKIDYYDKNLEYASPDPADFSKTKRVLTIMLSEEY